MGCKHCMINATADGKHMSIEVFKAALEFNRKFDTPIIQISGGEPLEHPQFFEFIEYAKSQECTIVLLSNGMFLSDPELKNRVLGLGVLIQITNDDRYYPQPIEDCEHPLVALSRRIPHIAPIGRAATNNLVVTRLTPLCYGLRARVAIYGDFMAAVAHLRTTAHFCTPSINIDGTISVGESNQCYIIGDITSSNEELTKAIRQMKCNQCGLEDSLPPSHKVMINAPSDN
jgi:hypothetical protein